MLRKATKFLLFQNVIQKHQRKKNKQKGVQYTTPVVFVLHLDFCCHPKFPQGNCHRNFRFIPASLVFDWVALALANAIGSLVGILRYWAARASKIIWKIRMSFIGFGICLKPNKKNCRCFSLRGWEEKQRYYNKRDAIPPRLVDLRIHL